MVAKLFRYLPHSLFFNKYSYSSHEHLLEFISILHNLRLLLALLFYCYGLVESRSGSDKWGKIERNLGRKMTILERRFCKEVMSVRNAWRLVLQFREKRVRGWSDMLQDHHFERAAAACSAGWAAVVVKTCRLTSLCGVNDNRWYHKKKRNSEGWRLKNIFRAIAAACPPPTHTYPQSQFGG